MHDLGLVRIGNGAQMLVSLIAGLAVGYVVAGLVGLAPSLGLMLGALPAFLTCFTITDEKPGRIAGRTAAMIVPFVLALYCSLALKEERVLELAIIVLLLFVQFYSPRFGVWAGDFCGALLSAYICGLLLPLPTTSIEGLTAIMAASIVSTIVVRSVFFRPNPYRALLLARRAFLGWARRVVVASVELIEMPVVAGSSDSARRVRRLNRRLAQLHHAALVADGMLARPGAHAGGEISEELHRVLFDAELAIDGLGHAAIELASPDVPLEVRTASARALGSLLDHGGVYKDFALPVVTDDPGVQRLSRLLLDLRDTAQRWNELSTSIPTTGAALAFQSPVVLAGGRVGGVAPVLGDTLANGGMSGPWRRLSLSPALRTGIQAAIAVAIVEPLAVLLGGAHFYWGVIGVLIILSGTNSTRERVRKVGLRIVGTLLGGIIGIALVGLLGTEHLWWTLIVVVVSLAVGVYAFSSAYSVWVACLVIAIFQVYAYSGDYSVDLLPLRLAENLLGAVIAVVVSAVILPVASSAMIRTAVIRQLGTLHDLFDDLARPSSDAAEAVRLRTRSRAIDQATGHLDSVMKPLVPISSATSDLRNDEIFAALVAVAGYARALAAQSDPPAQLPAAASTSLAGAATRLAASLDDLSAAVAGRSDGVWRRADTQLYRFRLDARDASVGSTRDTPTDASAWFERRVHLLARIDDALAIVATLYELRVEDIDSA
jgi:hypothetical protein